MSPIEHLTEIIERSNNHTIESVALEDVSCSINHLLSQFENDPHVRAVIVSAYFWGMRRARMEVERILYRPKTGV